MSLLALIKGIFILANTFIAVFIVIYAFLFLKKTKSHYERRPWDYLFIASIIYLTYNLVLLLLNEYHVSAIMNVNLDDMSMFFQFVYTGLILLAFISQTDLIFKNEIIIITRKLEPKERIKLEAKIEKDLVREEKEIRKETSEIKEKEDEIKKATDKIKREEDEIRKEENEIKTETREIKKELKNRKHKKK